MDGEVMSWEQGFQGAAGGAMAGGAVGGPIGAAVGAGLGGLAGYFGGDPKSQYQKQLQQLAQKYGRMQAPQAGPASQAGMSGFRQNQAGLVSQLEAMGRGEGPSAAQIQMREAMDRAAGAQASAAAGAGGRGVNAGAALRGAMNNTAAIQAQGARDTATLRAQEQFNALQQLGQVVGQGRGQDEQLGMFNAGQQNDMTRANLQAAMQTLGISTEAELKALMAAMGMAGPGLGTQILAGGASAFPMLLKRGGGNGQPGMSPIAAGNPGAGGFFTPQSGTQQFAPGFNYNGSGGFGNQ
jgi:hypothetical protein